jgi:hypothetical protein
MEHSLRRKNCSDNRAANSSHTHIARLGGAQGGGLLVPVQGPPLHSCGAGGVENASLENRKESQLIVPSAIGVSESSADYCSTERLGCDGRESGLIGLT